MKHLKPEILKYQDYRLFLHDFYLYKKSIRSSFTYEYCARKIKTSKSYLKQVFDHKIHVDINRVAELSKLFQMDHFEKQYFIVLLIENQLKEPGLKKHFSGILNRLKNNEEISDLKKYREKMKDNGEQLPGWLPSCIAAMTSLANFQLDPEWIEKKLSDKVPLAEIKQTIAKMLSCQMIRLENGKYVDAQIYHSPDPYEIESHKRYLHGAAKSIDVLSGDLEFHRPGLFFNGSLPIAKEDFKKIADAFYRFHQEIITISERAKSSERILYINSDIFHVTK